MAGIQGGELRDMPGDEDIEALLAAVREGKAAAMDRLIEAIYPELKRLAHFQLAAERPGHTLNTTAIVHEAYLRMAAGNPRWADRRHFLRAAATVMRHLLVDHARQRAAEKRGGGLAPVTLGDDGPLSDDDSVAVIALDDALKGMAEIDPRLEQIMECRYFAGMSVGETAEALGMSVRTVEREWRRAKGYLLRALGTDGA
jgi:RNA polymerase sigma factor (TIGR02999 family)